MVGIPLEVVGVARVLAKSAGGRDLHLVTYGEKNDLKSAANYNSACGGNDPASYARKDGTQRPSILFLGPVHGYLGILRSRLGEASRAERHFEAALARSQALGALIPEARAQCEYGELLLRRPAAADRERARVLLAKAHATAARAGAGWLERRTATALAPQRPDANA